jgi:protein-S-isoprenylcysteine O-methyltransferase Ste14
VRRPLASLYFLLQGFAVAAWWALLALRPDARALFLPPHNDASALLAFAAPDLALLAVGSLVTSLALRRGSGWALPVSWLVAGAVDYATLYVLVWAALCGGGWLGFVMMAPSALISTTLALDLAAAQLPLFRQAGPAPARWNLIKTFLHIVAFWSFFLALLPSFLAHVEKQMGWPQFAFRGQTVLAAAALAALSALGLGCGWIMAHRGDGTPLPLDATRRLVISGPYAYVRNPMAMAGLGQALAVGIGLGSPLVLAYVALGGAVWNWLVRPSEEADLVRHFGDDYERYRRAVKCWLPRLRPYLG